MSSVADIFLLLVHTLPTVEFKPTWHNQNGFYDAVVKDASIAVPCKAYGIRGHAVIILPQREGFNVIVFSRFIDNKLRICYQSRPQFVDDKLDVWKQQLANGLPVGGIMDDETQNFALLLTAMRFNHNEKGLAEKANA